jgi:predicted DCC family thiol-disulfide oxidoreductase YuxK
MSQDGMPSDYDIIFYDGGCGLCHGLVRFILPRDKAGRFRFAPLQGETLKRAVAAEQRASFPDSVVVLTASGEPLMQSEATIYVLHRLGGMYPLVAALFRLLPKSLRNRLYDFIARRRKQWFRAPTTVCPVVPKDLRARFLA